MSLPNRLMAPASARSSPVIRLNSVVLPAPFWPMMSRRSPGCDREVDRGGDAQAAERLVQVAHLERGHGPASRFRAGAGARGPRIAMAQRQNRTQPGTSPSGMNTTISTKMAPSTKFQRSM